MHHRVEHFVLDGRAALDPAKREGRIAHGILRSFVPCRAQGNTNTCRGENLLVSDLERRREVLLDAVRHPECVTDVAEVIEQNTKFVPAHSSERVDRAETGLESLRHRDQQLIAHHVPEAVVDQVETIEVQDQHREQVVGMALGAAQRLLDQVEQQKPVWQAGERILQRSAEGLLLVSVVQLLFRPSAFGDVLMTGDYRPACRSADHIGQRSHDERAAVLSSVELFTRPAGRVFRPAGGRLSTFTRCLEETQIAPYQLADLISVHLGYGRIRV